MKTMSFSLTACAVVVILSISVSAQPSAARQDSAKRLYEADVNAWHTKRIEGLKRPQGWLSLVALDWLEEGENKFGSWGVLSLNKGVVTFTVSPGIEARVGGKAFTSRTLKVEGGKEKADRVEIGTRVFTIIKRGENLAVRMWDSNAETLKNFKGVDRYPVTERWRIEARWEPYDPPRPIDVASVIPGYVEKYTVPGVAVFAIDGHEFRLEPVGSASEPLFFIFADGTNGRGTYGAGRFLYADPPSNGRIVLDFNKAINPPCAFTAYATCPLPSESNALRVRIEAGEKNFGDH
jgi:uncharacterized protein